MAKPELIWPGERMRAFFRAILASEPGLEPGLAQRLEEKLARPVNRMLVWFHPADSRAPAAEGTGPEAEAAALRESALAAVAPPAEPAFDPYAFSAIAVLTRGGRAALLDRLREIGSAEDLRRLAAAQHLAVGDNVAAIDALREAIVAGAEARIADRRAAAS